MISVLNPPRTGTHVVESLSDLPVPVGGVITLNGGSWDFYPPSGTLDIGANQLNITAITWINGHYCTVISANPVSVINLSAPTSIVVRDCTFVSVGGGDGIVCNNPAAVCVCSQTSMVAFGATAWNIQSIYALSLLNSPAIGSVVGFNIVDAVEVSLQGLFVDDNTTGIQVTGTVSSIDIPLVARFQSTVVGAKMIVVSGTVTTSLSVVSGIFAVLSGQTAIDTTGATLPTAGFSLTRCQFIGAGTYLVGYTAADVQVSFASNVGIANTSPRLVAMFQGGVTDTTLPTAGSFAAVLAPTMATSESQLCTQTVGEPEIVVGLADQSWRVTVQISATTSVANGDYQYQIWYDTGGGYAAIGVPASVRATSSSIDQQTVIADAAVVPAGTKFRLYAGKVSGTSGTLRWITGRMTIERTSR